MHLFLFTVFFYVCDLICVLIWCPFRLLMRNRCCTTCRIFNWDHLMMFAPMLFVRSFYAQSLLLMSLVVFIILKLFNKARSLTEKKVEEPVEEEEPAPTTEQLLAEILDELKKNNK